MHVDEIIAHRFQLTKQCEVNPYYKLWHARDLQTQGPVAVKAVAANAHLNGNNFAALTSLGHPHLLAAYGVWQHGTQTCIVSELPDGDTWADTLQYRQPTAPLSDELSAAVYAIGRTLTHLHSQHIIHGEVSASTIFQHRTVTKLLDVVSARVLSQLRPSLIGYAAPELLEGQVSPKIDVYALGVAVYHLLTGMLPFRGSDRDIMEGHIGQVVVIPAQVPEPWHRFITGCLEKNPARRWDALAVVRHLQGSTKIAVQEWVVPDDGPFDEAVRFVPEGIPIRFQPGAYHLQQSVTLGRSLQLRGASSEKTQLIWSGAGSAVAISGPGKLVATDLAFVRSGDQPGSVVEVHGGEVEFQRCRFTGGKRDATNTGGDGLVLAGDTTGMVVDCQAVENDGSGVVLRNQSQVRLDRNLCQQNQACGILITDSARGAATQNGCYLNQLHGIAVIGSAQPLIDANVCQRNSQFGIFYNDHASGTAHHNQCLENQLSGISLGGETRPLLDGNLCSQNGEVGIRYQDRAAGEARYNECKENGLSGVVLIGEAHPLLEENRAVRNRQAGIAYFGQATGTGQANECAQNVMHGIVLQDNAAPRLERNLCRENQQCGITYVGNSEGSAVDNQCVNNLEYGMLVQSSARPLLHDNVCVGNKLGHISSPSASV